MNRFADVSRRGKMDHRPDIELLQHLPHQYAIADIALNKGAPSHRPAVAGAQVVEHDGFEACLGERLGGLATDVSSAAGDQYAHAPSLVWPNPLISPWAAVTYVHDRAAERSTEQASHRPHRSAATLRTTPCGMPRWCAQSRLRPAPAAPSRALPSPGRYPGGAASDRRRATGDAR